MLNKKHSWLFNGFSSSFDIVHLICAMFHFTEMIPAVPHHKGNSESVTSPTQRMVHLFRLTKLWALSQRVAHHASSRLLGLWEKWHEKHSFIIITALFRCPPYSRCHVPPGSEVSMETVRSDSMQAACGSVWVGTGRCGEEPVPPLQHPKSGDLSFTHARTHKHTHTHDWTSFSKPLWTECVPPLSSPTRNSQCLINQCFVRLWWISSQNVF